MYRMLTKDDYWRAGDEWKVGNEMEWRPINFWERHEDPSDQVGFWLSMETEEGGARIARRPIPIGEHALLSL